MSVKNKLNIAVIGATGYTGLDLVYMLSKHPKVKLTNLVATKNLGKKMISGYSFPKNINVVHLSRNIKFRRSIYAKVDIKKNEKITNKNVSVLRPKIGICASKYFKILGKRSKANIKANDPIFQNQLL